MPDDSMDVLRRFYEAEEVYLSPDGGDFSVIAETLDPECVMIQPDSLPYAGEWRGHGGFERWMIAFGEQWAALSVQEPRFFPTGEGVVFVRSTVVARAKATGVELTWPLLQMITVRNGRILEIQPFYWDTAQVASALGTDVPGEAGGSAKPRASEETLHG